MPTVGILMRLSDPEPDSVPFLHSIKPSNPVLNIETMYSLVAHDGKTPSYASLYFLSDIEPILADKLAYEADLRLNSGNLTSLSWIILSFINGRDRRDKTESIFTTNPWINFSPPKASVVVLNGTTPRRDKEDDYHSWYDNEHAGKLSGVPGWRAMRRYKLEKVYGEAGIANFYGMNVYDEMNGLGGKEWQEGVTDWTLRIRAQAARPNIRRVWQVEEVTNP